MSQHSKQDCADFLERIVYLLDNELDDAECALVRIHLEECHPCFETYDLQRTVKQIVARSCTEKAPDGLRERVRVRIREIRVQISES